MTGPFCSSETVHVIKEKTSPHWHFLVCIFSPLPALWQGYLPANKERRELVLKRKREEYFGFIEQYYHSRTDEHYKDTYRQVTLQFKLTNGDKPLDCYYSSVKQISKHHIRILRETCTNMWAALIILINISIILLPVRSTSTFQEPTLWFPCSSSL